ncbi:acyl-CoA dehydrogenase family protein [Oleomonas cavernae]|uniref:Acyl-CoA dehydrogenase family protein n=1 Tax=Oleomonas cavernae TaxID=2320859 RepID=A0A418VZB5_9PROT|nr:acyl-CoA dehydrogenase family protein [Oleomonas cavernae]
MRRTVRRFIEAEINPHVDAWEAETIFPAHEVFKKMGDLGLLGIAKPEAYGGLGLDYSYSAVMSQELSRINSGGVAMAIGVQTDMATPALARFGSDELRQEFLAPSIAGVAMSVCTPMAMATPPELIRLSSCDITAL